ncbi:uncharacterized protein [Linepithema humile]|uniref:uncharacterized protein n=1 Tax=Linepithema humile TaxID=83485 RepID=UPI00351EA122
MDRLIAEQEDVINSIRRAVINFKKIGQKNYTTASTRNRLAILQEQWSRCQQLHAEIKITASTQDRATLSYFLDESFSVAEQEYYEASDLFSEVLVKLVKPVAISTAAINNSGQSECNTLSILLPRIELPKFSGVYTEWSNFRDLFESLVASNESLSNVQRLHYLKSSLTGQAQLVIKNITITDANYEVAWTALKRRYENLRAIVASYVNIILDVAPMKSDSVTELRRVHDTINDSFAVLCNMERSTINDFMVTITAHKRKALAKQYQVCFNCLHKGHFPAKCPSHNRCKRCQRKHHTLLHDDAGYNTNKVDESTNKANNSTAESSVSESISKSSVSLKVSVDQTVSLRKRSVLMATARILVCTDAGRKLCLRALIDTGSEATFITERAAQALKVKRQKTHIQVSGLGGQPSSVVQYNTKLTLKSCSSQEGSVVVTALVLPNLTSFAFSGSNPSSRERIDVLIGADIYGLILLNGLRKGTKDAPVAQRTIFGWILFGSCIKDDNMNYKVTTSLQCSITPSVDSLLRSFWEVEELVLPSALSSDDKICEQHFVSTYTRLASGRYVVRLPFKPSCKKDLGESYYLASKSLDRLEHRLSRNVKLSEAYQKFLHEYESLGHMAPLTLSEIAMKPNYYLPHHSVVKESSTSPVRVVFNASSASSNGVSLNDCLLTGPKLQTDLPSIILRWRMHRLVLVADIAKMYRQIMIHPDDTNYQRIIWRPNPDQPVEHYRLLIITYGMASVPFLAMRVLQQLCADEGAQYPLATPILRDSTYVDDILLGGDDVSTIQETRKQLNSLLQSGGFHLRKWTSNYEELLRDIPTVDRLDLNNVTFSESFITKVLGVAWNPTSDSFNFNNSLPTSPGSTKRCVLSTIARFFDPLGWITPIVISAKIFMQELWIRRVDWNSTLPGDLRDWWNSYYHSLFELRHITIPRWTRQSSSDLEVKLHEFADASTRAYAAVVYIRILSSLDYFHTTLIISKSKVAPIKTISIPRLELCAAVLLTRIIAFVQRILKSPETPVYCWSDSMITLAWIKQHPSSWKTFIANRVSEIQTSLPQAKWRYINSANNPADCASRATRAIHLELVRNYSSEGFIAAFRRFTARRGIPSTLLSDNGTNFHGAERELSHTFKSLSRNPDLTAYFANDRIEWKFIPPSALHFGGIWEAGVKSVKHHLRRVVGTHTLSIEELVTLLTQIEACLNSRPIAPLSDDPSDLTSLTPGHFLVGGPLVTIPEESLLDLKETRLNRWQRVQRMYEQFWRIWSKDYLHSLQQRHKWQYTQVNLKPNEIVLVRNDLLPPSKWELDRVMSTYPDDSGQVRVVEVKTVNGIYKRPIIKLCRLPVDTISLEKKTN